MHIHAYYKDFYYNLCTGALVGFADLGEIDKHLSAFQRQLDNSDTPYEQPLAKTMLVLMVRGLYTGLQFPYAQFPCSSLSGDQMFHVFWKAVGRLERIGFKVLGLTCDGLSANRRLFRLHGPPRSKELLYKVSNPYTIENRSVFFFSDPPHLLKTIRNCFASRQLWVYDCNMHLCNCISCSVFFYSSINLLAGHTLFGYILKVEVNGRHLVHL